MTYKQWLSEWLYFYIKPRVKPITMQKYERQIKLHINNKLGDYLLNDLSVTILQKAVASYLEENLSTNSIHSIISIIKSSLKMATLAGKAQKEFSFAIVCPKAREKQVECFTRQEQKKIEQYIKSQNDSYNFGIILTLYTGLRIGELLALTWKDIDLKKGMMHISKTCHDSWANGEYIKILDSPKTLSSFRMLPIPKQLLAPLKQLKRDLKNEYVISSHGKTVKVRTYQKNFSSLLKKLNIEHKGFHSLRHTFATRALECGMDVKTLAEILGHKTPTITLKRYAHSLLEYKTQMMNKLGKLYE